MVLMMKAKKHMQLGLMLLVALALVIRVRVTAAADQVVAPTTQTPNYTLPGCTNTCGNINIPYPFGTGISSSPQKNCSLSHRYNLNCTESKLYYGKNIRVLNISLEGHQMDVSHYVSKFCDGDSKANDPSLWINPSFSISSNENKFITVGCDHYGYLNNYYDGYTYSTGCLTRCYGNDLHTLKTKINGNCSGLGCCQVDIPPGTRNITHRVYNFSNFSEPMRNCGYSFLAKLGSYKFSIDHLHGLSNKTFPLVMDWTVGNESCSASSKNKDDYVCMKNSYCDDKDLDYGYRCRCKDGYEGNPYHPDGCVDIDECKTSKHSCLSEYNCHNIDGNHTCFCPKGQSGSGTKEEGCHQTQKLITIVIGVSVGVLSLVTVTCLLCLIHQRRKLIKLKEKYFRQNGGVILQEHLSTIQDPSQTFQVFTEEQLEKATNNYDESLILGRGGYGTVFKGILPNNKIVAVKKSRLIDQSQVNQFINEVVVLSQINHRNVVKLLGCCLETEVPLLVYEFVNNGTLFEYLHNESKACNVSWKTRLRIAAEAAEALSYLHSAASIPIIHRDVKSANILLDENYTAKVSDFGASRLVPLDQTELETIVQGTLGYLDPEYMQTSQLTEKSDVYSFGVVLVELLTGKKALIFDKSEEKISTAKHFLSCLKEGCLLQVLETGILNEGNKEEIKEVAVLASMCLSLKGEERPSMKQVAMELEGMRLMDKHPWSNTEQNLEESQYLLHEANSTFEHGNSSSYHQTTAGYDSLRDLELIVLDDGR
ncbi:hypothetical protein RIF29_16648 [Crotalaria pallida]|uniref:Uncharacterized protein n=1 Tax=Crotalaria pallida TaxID=3830 RepID=A0AAN9IEN1_CROPI